MTFTRSHRFLAALVTAAAIIVPATGEAAAKNTGDVTLKVFKPKQSGRHTISYKLHGLKGRSIVSARLRAKKGKKVVTKPVKLAKKTKMTKAVFNDASDGVIRLDGGQTLSAKKVIATASAVTVTRPAGISNDPLLVVAVETPAGETPAPSSAPSAPSTPASPCGPVLPTIPVGGARPPACWRPYGESSPFNQELPAEPRLHANSPAIVARMGRFGTPQNITAGWAGTEHNWARPTYFSSPTDPEYTIHCTKDWGKCMIEGMKVRIPEGAAPAAGGDGHLTVIDQTGGWEYSMYETSRRATGGGTLNISWGARTTIDGDGLADHKSNTANAAGYGNAAGLLRAEELEAGVVNHAILITVPCDNDEWVFPAHHVGHPCASDERGDAPAMGERFQLAMSQEQINALAVPNWKKAILRAMAQYGMFVGDTGGDSWAVQYESGIQYTSLGQPDKWVELAKKSGLTRSSSGAYGFNLRDGVDWTRYLRVIDPCVSERTC
jgi:hypothetical protein